MAITKTGVARSIELAFNAAARACRSTRDIEDLAISIAVDADTYSEAERFIAKCGLTNSVLPRLVESWRLAQEVR